MVELQRDQRAERSSGNITKQGGVSERNKNHGERLSRIHLLDGGAGLLRTGKWWKSQVDRTGFEMNDRGLASKERDEFELGESGGTREDAVGSSSVEDLDSVSATTLSTLGIWTKLLVNSARKDRLRVCGL